MSETNLGGDGIGIHFRDGERGQVQLPETQLGIGEENDSEDERRQGGQQGPAEPTHDHRSRLLHRSKPGRARSGRGEQFSLDPSSQKFPFCPLIQRITLAADWHLVRTPIFFSTNPHFQRDLLLRSCRFGGNLCRSGGQNVVHGKSRIGLSRFTRLEMQKRRCRPQRWSTTSLDLIYLFEARNLL